MSNDDDVIMVPVSSMRLLADHYGIEYDSLTQESATAMFARYVREHHLASTTQCVCDLCERMRLLHGGGADA